MKVKTEHSSNYDFSILRSYGWIPAPQNILNETDTYIHEDIRNAIAIHLQKAGLEESENAPDMHVAYYVKLREQLEYSDSGSHSDVDFTGGLVYDRETGSWVYRAREPDLMMTAPVGANRVRSRKPAGIRKPVHLPECPPVPYRLPEYRLPKAFGPNSIRAHVARPA